jgi:hypothetical protein
MVLARFTSLFLKSYIIFSLVSVALFSLAFSKASSASLSSSLHAAEPLQIHTNLEVLIPLDSHCHPVYSYLVVLYALGHAEPGYPYAHCEPLLQGLLEASDR